MAMKLFVSTNESLGIYPVGFAGYILIDSYIASEIEAEFRAKLSEYGCPTTDSFGKLIPLELREIDLTKPSCDILVTGNY